MDREPVARTHHESELAHGRRRDMGVSVRRGLLVVAVGLSAGVLTLVGQALLAEGWERLANSGAVWLSLAFAVGAAARNDREALVTGAVSLLLALVGYQLAASTAAIGVSAGGLVIWSLTACIGGPAFGLAGRSWRVGQPRRRSLALALLGAVYLAEGVYTLLATPRLLAAGWVEVVIGLSVPFLLGRNGRERRSALAWMAPLALLGLLVYELIGRAFLLT